LPNTNNFEIVYNLYVTESLLKQSKGETAWF